MTKLFKSSSLLFVLFAVTATVTAKKDECDSRNETVCNLTVKKKLKVCESVKAHEVTAKHLNVNCCGTCCPAMLGCEKCLLDTRGTVKVDNLNTDTSSSVDFLTYQVNPVRGNACFTVENIQTLNIQQLSGLEGEQGGYSAEVQFDVVFNKPYQSLPTVLLTVENNAGSLRIPPVPVITNFFVNTVLTIANNVSLTGFTYNLYLTAFVPSLDAFIETIAALLNENDTFLDFAAQGSIDCPIVMN